MYLYATRLKPYFAKKNTLINLCMSATTQFENVQYYGILLENKKRLFLISYLVGPRPTLIMCSIC